MILFWRFQQNLCNKKKEHSHYIPIFFLGLGLAFMLLFLMLDEVGDATYYASPGGGGNGSSPSMPFQIEDFWSVATPGDTLILLDGTFTGSRSMINPKVNGTASSPITIKALNDGLAILDGEFRRRPVLIEKNYIVLEGFRAQNSSHSVVIIFGSQHNVVRRVSAYNAHPDGNHAIIVASGTSYVLFEDCIVSGTGRDCYRIYNSDHVTLRRCWGKWMATNFVGPHWGQIYGSHHCTVENCVGTMDTSSPSSSRDDILGLSNWCAEWNPNAANHNKYLGNIFYDFVVASLTDTSRGGQQMTGNRYTNCVVIGGAFGVMLGNDDDLRMNKLTVVNSTFAGIDVKGAAGYVTNADLRNSVLLGGGTGIRVSNGSVIHSYNDVYGFTTPYSGTSKGPGELAVNPGFKVGKYGKGAYLFVPEYSPLQGQGEGGITIGAEVLYQYENGVLTDKRLWPWPMEDRIFKETGVSVTWESHGGLWKTLDGVYI